MFAKSVSPSRTYIVLELTNNNQGMRFHKVTLPDMGEESWITNHSHDAQWYFLNRLNFTACIAGCVPVENFNLEVKTYE
jgi:hypothetical protein